ncbi:MAG TPA: DHHA1 domain-containing protein [Anaerolineaceae bacterium]|jgi:phosphoesterase RecJ-like protein|nr:DHHA1 domain-containing protein [Anaerolineaceae bacterium]
MNEVTVSLDAQIRELFAGAERILILSHIRPDGDAVGSTLGLGLALQAVGKKVQMVLADGVIRTFRHLPGADQILQEPTDEFDILVTLDASDPRRLGKPLEGRTPDLNIDHHVTNLNFGRLNLVMPEAVATAAILAERLPDWGLPIPPDAAAALLTGLLTDTIGFRTSNMNANALRLGAMLVDQGADLPELYRRALIVRTYAATRYWGLGLSRLNRKGRLCWTTLTLEDRKTSGYQGNDDADLTNILSSIDECDIVVLFIEQHEGSVKVSWRSQPGYDVSQLAFSFGGGGHSAAAGADIPGTLAEVCPRVIQATEAQLKAGPAVV